MPFYTQAEFFRLMEEAQNQGGEHIDAVHEHVYHEEFSGGPVHDVLQGQVLYCNEQAIFELPYVSLTGDLQPVRICAICDRMGLMPRLASAKAPGKGD